MELSTKKARISYICITCLAESIEEVKPTDTLVYNIYNNVNSPLINVLSNARYQYLCKEKVFCPECKKEVIASFILMPQTSSKLLFCNDMHIIN
jgi:hypothetical protein